VKKRVSSKPGDFNQHVYTRGARRLRGCNRELDKARRAQDRQGSATLGGARCGTSR
jgi:hypothetical protein